MPGRLEALEGTRVRRYLLRDRLGHGSHTAVYRAMTPAGEWCALKLVDARLHGTENLAERLRRDARVLDRIAHPQIVPIQNPITADDMTAAAMPLVEGVTLRDLMRSGSLDSDMAWTILTQVSDTLTTAHQSGLSYKVLKPANILVREGRAQLAEFGITGRYAGRVGLSAPEARLPAPQYLAPEQILGEEPDHRADIYAFAVLVFELATASALYEDALPSAVLRRTLSEPPPSANGRNPRVPPEVDGVLRRALARNPRGRHGSVGELLEQLAYPPHPNGARRGARAQPPPRLEESAVG